MPSTLDMAMKPHLVTATEIAQWANTLQARAVLPKLIRKLALASKIPFHAIRFSSDEGIQEPDWDGFLDSPSKTTFIPKGRSGWEVSAQKTVRVKADKDIATRTKAIRAKERKGITYVCVTTRRWADKKSWVKTHNAKSKKRWRKVIAYDATDLETWLESAPVSVHVWLSELLGKKPLEVASIEATWSAWADVTKPVLSPRLIKAGRAAQVENLIAQFDGPAQPITIKGETRDEVQAFVAATILGMPAPKNEETVSRTLVVKSRAAWDLYAMSEVPLILVAMFDERNGIEQAVFNGHTVIIPMDRSDGDHQATIELPPIDRPEAQEALREMGCNANRVRELALSGRKSFMSLRRQLATVPAIHAPKWSKSEAAGVLVPALLVGSWSDRNEEDRALLSRLSGQPYEEIRARWLEWNSTADTPLKLVGGTWYVVSREDLWRLLAKHLTAEHLENFSGIAREVLSKAHPRFNLPPAERFFPRMSDSTPVVSDALRHGIVDGLAFMGARGSGITLADQSKIDQAPERVVHDVLKAANLDWRIWATLSYHLSALAEAAPAQFIAGVAAGLKRTPSPLGGLFVEEGGAFFPQHYHSGLISALETLAWKAEYVAPVADLLADLMPLDPVTQQANRPLERLYQILQPWLKNSSSTAQDRLMVMTGLRSRRPEQAFRLLVRMMPTHHHFSGDYTHVPRWRDWEHERPDRWNPEEVRMTLTKVGEWLIEDAAQNADRCFRLCECAGDTRTPFFKQVMDHLLNVDISSWSSEERLRVWDKLRDVHTHHSNYKSQPQAMPEPMLQLLEGPMRRFEPTDPETHYRWVFGGAHPLPREEREDYHALQERLTDEGATAILTATGTEGIMRMVDKVENPWWLGYATGRVVHSPADEFVLLGWSLANEDQKLRSFGKGLVSGLFKKRGWDWAHTLFASAEWPDWTAAKRGALLSVLPFDDATWTVVQTHGAEIEAAYWSTCEPWGTLSPAQAQFAGEHFLKHGRPLRALIAIIHQGHGEDCTAPTPLITAALEACTKTYREESKEVHMPSYTITEAHKIVRQRDDADRQRVALIEWVFFPLLDEKDLILYAEMAKDPVPFADFLGYFSKPTEPSDIELTEQDRNIARRAYEVLSGWKGAPAVAQDGTLSFEALDEWYTKAVATVQAKGRMWGDYIFGEKLRYAPADPDGTWPCVAVRRFLEKYQSDTLERAIATEVYNSRGVHTPDAGASERALSEHYDQLASSMEIEYPSTARMLRNIAQDYRRDADSEGKRHEIEQDTEYHM